MHVYTWGTVVRGICYFYFIRRGRTRRTRRHPYVNYRDRNRNRHHRCCCCCNGRCRRRCRQAVGTTVRKKI